MIRLIASDLDATLLDRDMQLSPENENALTAAIAKGIHFVPATGRSLSSIPDFIAKMPGVRYLITANGAKVYDRETETMVLERYLARTAVESVLDMIDDGAIMKEIFVGGTPYISRESYDYLAEYGVPDYFREYVKKTRVPVDDLPAFARRHMDDIENINFNYGSDSLKAYLEKRLSGSELFEFTKSLPFNFEIGGLGVDKASALSWVCERIGIPPEDTIAFGDNDNDASMLRFAGIGVAVGNSVEAALAAADYVTAPSYESGVAKALAHFGIV
jgi:Cof subfamily protein (haloacid dehalogenase superfamily)